MKIYITHSTFKECAQALSNKDLRQARLNARDLLLFLESDYVQDHNLPWRDMWHGHEGALCLYGMAVSYERHQRGHPDMVIFQSFERHRKQHVKFRRSVVFPWWLEDDKLHETHRATLAFQDPDHYARLFPGVDPQPALWWPPKKKPPIYTDPTDEEEF